MTKTKPTGADGKPPKVNFFVGNPEGGRKAETPARTEPEIITELWEKSDSVKKSVEELFVIECKECGSKDVKLFHDMDFTEGTGGGCESCGYGGDGGSAKFLLALKCMKCGNAKVVKEKRGEMYG